MTEFANYFNYFTEIEEHFQRARGTSLFLLSPLDWALIETWKNSEVPLEAVLRGIDASFEKWRARRSKVQQVNSLAFCSQAVLTEAQRAPGVATENTLDAPFSREELSGFLQTNLVKLRQLEGFGDVADALAGIAGALEAAQSTDLEELDQRLTVLEQRIIAIARSRETDTDALDARRDLDSQLAPYRRKMSAPQLAMLEKQFLERKLLERFQLPRLSLFYLR